MSVEIEYIIMITKGKTYIIGEVGTGTTMGLLI